jgi:hypothetical protein
MPLHHQKPHKEPDKPGDSGPVRESGLGKICMTSQTNQLTPFSVLTEKKKRKFFKEASEFLGKMKFTVDLTKPSPNSET